MKARHTFADHGLIAATDGNKGYLSINRPDRKNAINFEMWREFPRALEWLCQQGDIRCIVLHGEGPTDFSAGADITEFDAVRGDSNTAQHYEHSNSDAFRAVRLCPVPVVAMIRGICFGGAFGLAAASDLRVASNEAEFSVPAGRLGLAYPVDAMSDIVEALGPQLARSMLFTARRLGAREAHTAGFLHAICGLAELENTAEELTDRICANAPLTNRAAKASIRAALSGTDDDRRLAEDLAETTF
ncbi:MAG: enoyl-CoA hydratase-related protein [Pseudomonadota bacterium]